MMGLLNSGMDGMGAIDPMLLQNLFAGMAAQNANPMMRPIAGEQYLQGLGQMPGIPSAMGNLMGGGADGFGQDNPQPGVSTDFGNISPGLPNLPDKLTSFGFGATAPKMFEGQQSLRRSLIDKLFQSMGGAIPPLNMGARALGIE